MKFSSIPVFALVTAICSLAGGSLAQGYPDAPSVRRGLEGFEFDELVVRTKKSSGANKGAITASVQGVQKAQAARITQKKEQKSANKKVQDKATASIKVKNEAMRAQVKKQQGPTDMRKLNAASDALKKSEKGRVAGQAQRDHKEKKAAHWAAQVKTPEQKAATKAAATARRADRKAKGEAPPPNQVSTKAPARSKDVKHATKQQFQAAAKKLKDTQGLPNRKDKIGVGKATTDGRAVRQSVFNSYLHSKSPIGRNPENQVPKHFRNERYAKDHADPALQNKKPLPKGGKEYPIINTSPVGFTASNGKPGPLRTITYKKGGQNHAAVIGHDPSRGGSKDDHYVGKKI